MERTLGVIGIVAVVAGCSGAEPGKADVDVAFVSQPERKCVVVATDVALAADIIGVPCDGGTTPPEPDAGEPPDEDAGQPPNRCDGLPTIDFPGWSTSKAYESKHRSCANGGEAFLAWKLSASATGQADPGSCSASGKVKGALSVTPQLCGRLGGSLAAKVSGTAQICETPKCDPTPTCEGPTCASDKASFDASVSLSGTWNVGDILPPARPFCDNRFVQCTISVDLHGSGHADQTNSSGAGWCGCCSNGAAQDVTTMAGNLSGSITGKLVIDVGWIGNAELTATGSACVSGRRSSGTSCTGKVDELSGGWQISASASGRACLGKGWFEYCRDFSGGPWTAGPGCE